MSDNTSSDALQKGMQTANTVKGAVKTGKAIAAAAKGGAAGGWIGAVVSFAWENRKLFAKIIIATIALMLIPIMIILLLPSIIFGGTGEAYSPDDTNNPILNNPTVISENIDNLTLSIEDVFDEGLKITMDEIEQDIASLPDDTNTEIITPTINVDDYNKSLIISQYCASRDEDYTNISIDDFKTTINGHADKIFYYEKKEELRPVNTTVITVDSETGEETTSITTTEQTFTVYTIFYNDGNYFADNIFMLSEKQKELANNYCENLSIYLNGGI